MTKTPRWLFGLLVIPMFLAESLGMWVLMFSSGFRTALKHPELQGKIAMHQLFFPGPIAIVLGTMLEVAVLILAVWLLYKWGFIKWQKPNWKVLLWGCLLGFLMIMAIELLGNKLIELQGKDNSLNQAALESMLPLIPAFFMILTTVVTAPVLEELIFRGMIQQGVFRNSWLGYLVSSLLFGLAHTPDSLGAAVIYMGMGFVLGFLAFRFQRLEYSISLHLLNNLVAIILMYQLS